MKLVVSAGDPSGDARASEVLAELSGMVDITTEGLGGDSLARCGMKLHHHLRDYSVMGFGEVAASIGRLLKLRKSMRSLVLSAAPDALLLVDYPGLNIPLGIWARSMGVRVVYYISPQLWAWGTGRVRKVARGVDLMLTLFRFEVDFYRNRGIRAEWAGHPLVDSVPTPQPDHPEGHLALLPGSRAQEISALLPSMLDAFRTLKTAYPGLTARLAAVGSVPRASYADARGTEGVEVRISVQEALEGARAALVCSGTATLETALHGVPFVIAYRTSPLTYALARIWVRGVERIGMANIVTGQDIAPEIIQGKVSGGSLANSLLPIMCQGAARTEAIRGTGTVRDALGEPGGSRRAAMLIRQFVEESSEAT